MFRRCLLACCVSVCHLQRRGKYPRQYYYAQLLESEDAKKIFPGDAIARAKQYLQACKSTGAYSESRGTALFREQIAEVIASSCW